MSAVVRVVVKPQIAISPFLKVKLGHFLKFAYICTCNKQIEEAAEHLKELARKVDETKMGKPTFLMVLTGGEFAYQRTDGVLVVPIGCLKD